MYMRLGELAGVIMVYLIGLSYVANSDQFSKYGYLLRVFLRCVASR